MKCNHCGAEIANDSNFCEFCGKKVSNADNSKKGPNIWFRAIAIVIFLIILVLGIMVANKKDNYEYEEDVIDFTECEEDEYSEAEVVEAPCPEAEVAEWDPERKATDKHGGEESPTKD